METTRFRFLVLAALALGGLGLPVQAQPSEKTAIRLGEAEAGNLVADAVRQSVGAEIALVPAAAFKGSKALSPEAATALLDPATDEIVVLSIRGSQLKDALERSVSFAGTPFAGFLQVSGLTFQYNGSFDVGERVVKITVGGAPLDPKKTYKLATTKPLADGQQGYFQIWKKDQIVAGGKTVTLAEAMRALPAGTSAKVEGRIVRVDK
ncbi:5'-nucleotidase C-terminal domain-containing protein [Armatimonas rosea]|uniref:2',3'-cyclic-nucleotide 2'-phosphodiesterase (5'-nucleotidase family) n=1 Tax=Armatimonas rosea TaxID=685828 RepID=A0A7W9W8U6_ARMRO|nr:5'-nucleotidase [Armatimonas rosea]MBB6051962.1 2',3'-cyclic-nucleotide 2'-phosphodiesterase (5'-nucleotidase family) [Armatimonas rosea]